MQIGSRSTGGVVKITVTSGGTGYTSPPTVAIAGGTGAVAIANLAGSQVESISIVASGSGYTSSPGVSFSGGGGTGAAATANAYVGSLRPMSFFKGRYSDLYGVDGMGRGIQWDGSAASVNPIGLIRPAVAPAITASTTGYSGRVVDVQLVNGGAGYNNVPTVTFSGTAASTAQAKATLTNGRVSSIVVTDGGRGYSSTPTVSVAGGIGGGATFDVGVLGSVNSIDVTASGSGYTSVGTLAPTVVFSTTNGLTGAHAIVNVDASGRITGVFLTAAGTGATTSGVAASISAGTGSGAALNVNMLYSVNAVTVANTGSGFHTAPIITFRRDIGDPFGSGAAATAFVNTTGNVTGASVYAGGQYRLPPTALILDTGARATATMSQPMRGVYQCCVRYVAGTESDPGGQRASSISDLVEVNVNGSAQSISWTVSTTNADDRATALELWRTTSDQSVLLFRVATIPRASWGSAYVDSLDDDDLTDPTRDGYALMPITLPSGQINARRFGIPPAEMSVACAFQDRAWYAVDSTGTRPNSLMFSEVDEFESVPAENELVLQENTGVPDKIVTLIPFASQLLIAQSFHLYSLTYVAQPVVDASIRLAAYRGVLNSRCWDVIGGVAYMADSSGMYAFDGAQESAISVAVDNYWRDKIIDFSKSDQFHVRADLSSKTVRFFYCQPGDSAPTRALCYGLATQSWWEEQYPVAVTAACPLLLGGRYEAVNCLADGSLTKNSGTSDSGSSIPYEYRSGPMAVKNEQGSRSIGVLYKPTATTASLGLRLHYNNSSQPRANAIAANRGDGFVTTTGSTEATLNMSVSRSSLGDAVGVARAYFAGRAEDRSAGADRHVAVAVAGSQPTSEQVVLYGLTAEGVG